MYHTHIKELVAELNKAADAYYNTDTPIMSDALYDLKFNKLLELEKMTGLVLSSSPTQRVGAPILKDIPKMEITDRPMLSLKKVYSTEEINDFAKHHDVIAMVKVDGLSIRLIYEDGRLLSANTRGDGYVGSDITSHIPYFKNVPLSIPTKERYVIDGEAIIYRHDFEEINKGGAFKNPRNTAAGALGLLDMDEVRRRRLSFIAWDVISDDASTTLVEALENADTLGFTVVPYFEIATNEEVMSFAEEAGIPCDGVVWKYNLREFARAQDRTSHHWNDGVAWKPQVESINTNLIDIEWSMGRTGVLTPVAIFEPVELEETIVERANLHNPSIIEEVLGRPYKGQEIEVIKANYIIPQVISGIKASWLSGQEVEYLDPPDVCPICGQMTVITDDSVVCGNPSCEGKLINILDHYCGKRGLDIKGLSKATLEKLVDWGWVSDIQDIYELAQHRTSWMCKPGFGEKSVDKILAAIQTSAFCDLNKFISALGIPLIGPSAAKALAEHFGSWDEFRRAAANNYAFEFIEDFGPAMAQAIIHYNFTSADKIVNSYITFNEQKEEEKGTSLEGLTFVITGTLNTFKNRNELKDRIISLGGRVTNVVTGNTSYLINNNIESNSSKNREAKELGIKIITEEDFCENFLKL